MTAKKQKIKVDDTSFGEYNTSWSTFPAFNASSRRVLTVTDEDRVLGFILGFAFWGPGVEIMVGAGMGGLSLKVRQKSPGAAKSLDSHA